MDQLIISFDHVLKEIKELSNTANRLLSNNEDRLSQSIHSIEAIASTLENQTQNINNTITNISTFSNNLNSIDFVLLSTQMLDISNQLESLLVELNSGNGSVSKFINEDSIYYDLSNTIQSMDNLLIDIKNNPKKYINLSLWGGDKKSNK